MMKEKLKRQPRVLLVEDNELNLMMACELLQLAGYDVIEARDGNAGIRMARKHKPDIILMDMYMPIQDGYEATRIIKSDRETRDIPVVAFTASAMSEDKKRAEAVGCSGIISKPIIVDTFAETVASFLNPLPLNPLEVSIQ